MQQPVQIAVCCLLIFLVSQKSRTYYGKALHFKGPHDGIGGAIKRKHFSDVTAQKVVIQNASHFCSYASNVYYVNVIYLGKSEVQIPDDNDSSYGPGTHKIHQVKQGT